MLNDENLLTLAEAANRLPRFAGKRVAASTPWRWSLKGIRGIKLETIRVGRRVLTSLEALERFATALAALPPERRSRIHKTTKMVRRRSEKERERAIAKADARLDAAGVGRVADASRCPESSPEI